MICNWYGSHSTRGMGDESYWYYVCDTRFHPTPDSRFCKEQKVWIIRSMIPLEGFREIEYAVVRGYLKVGY